MGDSSNPSSLDRFHDWMKPKCDDDPSKAVPAADPHLTGNGLQYGRPHPAGTELLWVACQHCGALLQVPSDSGGERDTCPTCANILPIPVRGADGPPKNAGADAQAGRPAESPASAIPHVAPPAAVRSVSPGCSSASFFESPLGMYLLLAGGLPLAGFIFYNCLGGGGTRPTKSYIEEKFETFKPRNSK